MITDLDRHVGAVLDALDELDLADNTLVVFTSDNGTTHPSGGDPVLGVGGVDAAFFDSTRGLRGFKGSVYEGGIRVPMIARWPGEIAAGSVSNEPTHFADAFPTLCEAASIPFASELDGISLLTTLTGETETRKRPALVWIFPEYGGQVAVRFGDWKLVRRGLGREKPGTWELYDLSSDARELKNLALEHPDVVEQGAGILRDQMSENPLFPVVIP